jgi:glycosyltransferase involved in cell wall biosynthesis
MARHESGTGAPLVVFADDWGRHPSSCQHLVGHLLERHGVWWVNTIGMRRPGLDLATLSRAFEKLRQWVRPPRSQRPVDSNAHFQRHPHVLTPWMLPSFGSRVERRINRAMLVRQLAPQLRALPETPLAITTIPIVADLVGSLPVRRWVYYCVDDFAEWPGLDGATLRAMESLLIERADVLVAVSQTLQDKIESHGRTAHLLTHGVDSEFWQACPESGRELEGLERPLIVFWGVVDRRMDGTFIARLSTDLSRGTIVLVGPESNPDPALERLPRVVSHPPVAFERLPAIAQAASVLIMPYADLPVTRAMQPLKLKEYLATGKPVVACDLPSTRLWADALDLVTTPQDFSRAVTERLATGLPEAHKQARVRLAEESWAAKANAFERWLLHDEPAPHLDRREEPVSETCS